MGTRELLTLPGERQLPERETKLNLPLATDGRLGSDFIAEKWESLCQISGFPDTDIRDSRTELLEAVSHWAQRPLSEILLHHKSYINDSGFPLECSISWSGSSPEVRLMFECLGADFTPRTALDAGRALTRELSKKPGVNIKRYLSIEDLFISETPPYGHATIWLAMARRAGTPSKYKIYLDARAQGVGRAPELVGETMDRMGMSDCWKPIASRQGELVDRGHEIEFLALDLETPETARVKIYYRHNAVKPNEIDTVASLAYFHDSTRAINTYKEFYTDTIVNSPMTCLSFRGHVNGPEHANVYLRLSGAESQPAVRAVMRREGITDEPRISGARAEFLSFRTTGQGPADVGLYMRFPQSVRQG